MSGFKTKLLCKILVNFDRGRRTLCLLSTEDYCHYILVEHKWNNGEQNLLKPTILWKWKIVLKGMGQPIARFRNPWKCVGSIHCQGFRSPWGRRDSNCKLWEIMSALAFGQKSKALLIWMDIPSRGTQKSQKSSRWNGWIPTFKKSGALKSARSDHVRTWRSKRGIFIRPFSI